MAGEASTCPHCREVILRARRRAPPASVTSASAAVGNTRPPRASVCPLSVDGKIRHPGNGADLEYSVIVEIHDERDKIVARRVVGVGALRPSESRKFTLRVEVLLPEVSTLAER